MTRAEIAPPALERLLALESPAMKLAEAFRARSHELYIVGGWVRDAFLARPANNDLDFATDATPEQTQAIVAPLASSVWLQGKPFGTVGAEILGARMEITTFRSERYARASRRPEVSFETDITTDLSRRDFTINAMAVRLPERTVLDPCGGLEDLAARRIRTPLEARDSLTDDPLRVLRAFRFASQLSFDVDGSLIEAIAELRDRLSTVSAERIRDELTKLVAGESPGHALQAADRAAVVELILPEVAGLKLAQDPVHRHKDVWLHTLAVVERTRPDVELRLAALLHDIGKPKTRRIGPDGVSFHFHEVVGAEMAERRLRALRYPNHTVDAVSELIRLHHRFHTYRLGWSDAAVRRYARDAGPLLGRLNELVRADCTTRNRDKAARLAARMDELESRIEELAAKEELARLRPEIDGHEVMNHLGLPPGPLVGRALEFLLEIRLEEGLIGRPEALKRLEEWAREQGIEARAGGG